MFNPYCVQLFVKTGRNKIAFSFVSWHWVINQFEILWYCGSLCEILKHLISWAWWYAWRKYARFEFKFSFTETGCFVTAPSMIHPCEKVIGIFFSTQFFYHLFFVVCSSFYTWYMWGGQYQLCKFLLDFDHWLCLSDILKKVTGSKPDVALVWFMQWAKMELEHGEKDRYWCIVRV